MPSFPIGLHALDDVVEIKQYAHHRNADSHTDVAGQRAPLEEEPTDGDSQYASEDEGGCGFGLEDAHARAEVPEHRHQGQISGHDDDCRDKTPIHEGLTVLSVCFALAGKIFEEIFQGTFIIP